MSMGYAIWHTSPTGACDWITPEVVKSFIGYGYDEGYVVIGFADEIDASISLAYYLTERFGGAPLYDHDPLYAPKERHRITAEVLRRRGMSIGGNEYRVRLASLGYLSDRVLKKDPSANCYVYGGGKLHLFDYIVR